MSGSGRPVGGSPAGPGPGPGPGPGADERPAADVVEPPDDGTHRPLLDAVAVMARLRAPGGCPWDAEQTHASLGRYLVEECYELLDAIESGDPDALREELGDVLLQVLFHAVIESERGTFDIDDVAAGLVDKLVRRHPHVFPPAATPAGADGGAAGAGDAPVLDAADQQVRWDELKRREAGRNSVTAGVALGQPAVALAGKLGARAAKFGIRTAVPTGDSVGEQLFRIAYAAGAAGGDPESELRAVAREHARALSAAEADHSPG